AKSTQLLLLILGREAYREISAACIRETLDLTDTVFRGPVGVHPPPHLLQRLIIGMIIFIDHFGSFGHGLPPVIIDMTQKMIGAFD
ncbi:MAG TPA: hypothetical protein DDZ83_03945, partial [Nitrospinae bacterium]|nr:hypothetical protein [Nitrospinota bacterium]